MYPYFYYQPYVYLPMREQNENNGRAFAEISGSQFAPNLRGYVFFTDVPNGTNVSVEVWGLPNYQPAHDDKAPVGPHGFHIHEKGDCAVGKESDPYKQAGGHWNPDDQPHGHHAGDFPVLFSNNGYARMTFFTNRFKSQDVIDRSVIIHENPDDYRTQPSGDSGKRIGCGVIQEY